MIIFKAKKNIRDKVMECILFRNINKTFLKKIMKGKTEQYVVNYVNVYTPT